ncbi:hypothetical protein QOZ95_005314 [Paenibacillus brasilensis]|uniref:Uncharacterized protein n=1 Tax=Paenibacillus brasilensis TaxID=128574 RepID=A0ABU0L733_9BACL|nr:hypothetical protein [Paenibacillus brasilensis]
MESNTSAYRTTCCFLRLHWTIPVDRIVRSLSTTKFFAVTYGMVHRVCSLTILPVRIMRSTSFYWLILFYIGSTIVGSRVERTCQWDSIPSAIMFTPYLLLPCLRLVGTQIPYNKRCYGTQEGLGAVGQLSKGRDL